MKTFVTKPNRVQAIQALEENLPVIKKQIDHNNVIVKTDWQNKVTEINIGFHDGTNLQALPGEWIVKDGNNWDVYTETEFENTFEPLEPAEEKKADNK